VSVLYPSSVIADQADAVFVQVMVDTTPDEAAETVLVPVNINWVHFTYDAPKAKTTVINASVYCASAVSWARARMNVGLWMNPRHLSGATSLKKWSAKSSRRAVSRGILRLGDASTILGDKEEGKPF
jgi:hypothetical protein